MTWQLRHRGPDDWGVFTDGPVGLGSRRLAIIDLSAQGHQPLCNEDGSVWIVFNGEIYNFQELRTELLARGHRFRSHTDTEVVVHLYEEHGVECLQRLRGMFALAIWDRPRRTLVLARDRLGKKPLFYHLDAKGLRFASEPKAILGDPAVAVEPDPTAIHYYLTYTHVPSPMSAFQGFRKLPPAHYLTVRDGSVQVRRYWRLRYQPKVRGREEELCEELRHRLLEAVRLRMISDVPLGAFLSGGIDSSAVVAFMCQLSGRAVRTFSIGFEEDEYNELPYARRVARLFGTDHHEFVVKPNAVDILPELVWYYNEPYADSSALPTYYLSKLAREYVTVALNGDAGDESFAGYEAYRSMQRAQRLNRLPVWVRRGLAQAARLVPDSLPHEHLLRRGKRFIDHPLEDLYRKYGRGISCFTDEMKAGTYTEEFYARVGELDSLSPALDVLATTDASDPVEAVQDLDVNLTLPDDLLVKVDIASMAHGLEARSPLCDHLVMEFARDYGLVDW
jgi:asparagine synthase (glutamine-hydrolysing)